MINPDSVHVAHHFIGPTISVNFIYRPMSENNFHLDTERLRLRPIQMADLDALHRQWTEPGVRRYLWDDEIIPRETVEAVIRSSLDSFAAKGYGFWMLLTKEGDELIGFCGLRAADEEEKIELLYGLSESWWGRGLAVEASQAVIDYGRAKCGLTRILAITDAPNRASVRVMEKLGMKFDKRALHHGLDSIFYVMTDGEN